ncbi:hypothetical protein PTSG_02747 [Salpingoeca rosetta]|uniref:Uncharacterized protein n=1 Tax=Salpingoeca rosetta (strain ATCC 50818 / BSB-021) TaxID=946362 RepID=F2U372_SALR5|nr:uncharacterized protein PTSG_02747 [Salpingoeca rosetta]EGD82066.1 hypothetical protein PTSG_02747 [Salpingoeca rosetta]|eukprot:XP_004996249.1 hypothetical protein PTSG_02747 [Salpingoeca rosetta]
MRFTLLCAAVVACVLVSGVHGVVNTIRAPVDEFMALMHAEHQECTAIYEAVLDPDLTVQGNDIGMWPTHGKDTTITPDDPRYSNFHPWTNGGTIQRTFGDNFEREPYRDDPARQARAADKQSVTALTEDDATPLGFQRDTLRQYHAVCVHVRRVHERWVEIMAETLQPDQQVCVTDWNRPDLAENVHQESCGNGNLYTCRESTNSIGADGKYDDTMSLKFYCRESCDDPDFEFYWRIVASQDTPIRITNPDGSQFWQQPDGENWCAHRAGDDFPSSLLKPYPVNYEPPAVFERSVSAAATAAPAPVMALLAASLLIALALFRF